MRKRKRDLAQCSPISDTHHSNQELIEVAQQLASRVGLCLVFALHSLPAPPPPLKDRGKNTGMFLKPYQKSAYWGCAQCWMYDLRSSVYTTQSACLMDRDFLTFKKKKIARPVCFWTLGTLSALQKNELDQNKSVSRFAITTTYVASHNYFLILLSLCSFSFSLFVTYILLYLWGWYLRLDHPLACCPELHAVLKQSYFPRQSSVIWEASGDTSFRAGPWKLSPASWHGRRVKY